MQKISVIVFMCHTLIFAYLVARLILCNFLLIWYFDERSEKRRVLPIKSTFKIWMRVNGCMVAWYVKTNRKTLCTLWRFVWPLKKLLTKTLTPYDYVIDKK